VLTIHKSALLIAHIALAITMICAFRTVLITQYRTGVAGLIPAFESISRWRMCANNTRNGVTRVDKGMRMTGFNHIAVTLV